MSEEEKIDDSPHTTDASLPAGQAGQQSGVQISEPVVKSSELTDKTQSPKESEEQSLNQEPAIHPSTINPVRTAVQPGGPKPSTTEMEVHHHGHVHEKKKWKEYVFQFFMLFLAVFCGFLAEWQLEHMVENNREKQYIRSFVEDLKTDTLKINRVLQITKQQQNGFDSLMGVIAEPGFREYPENVNKYLGNIFILQLFNQTNRTLQQLKNAGGLRLVRSQAASDSIIQYDDMVKQVSEQGQDIYNSNQATIRIAFQIFTVNNKSNSANGSKEIKVRLITRDDARIDEFYNWVLNFKAASVIYCSMLTDLKDYASRQITFLKKEYHLK